MSNQSFIPLSTNTHSTAHCSIHSSHRIRMWSACITEERYIAITAAAVVYTTWYIVGVEHANCVRASVCMSESDVFVTFIFRFICLVLVCWPISICHLVYSGFTISFSPISIQCYALLYVMCQHCCWCVQYSTAYTPYVCVLDLLTFGLSMCAKPVLYHNNICELSVRRSFFLVCGWLGQSEKLMVFCVCVCVYLSICAIAVLELLTMKGSFRQKTKTKTISTAPKKRKL